MYHQLAIGRSALTKAAWLELSWLFLMESLAPVLVARALKVRLEGLVP
jgi:hypothetical protein